MKIYPGSDFQLCTIHYMRGLKSKVKEKDLEIIDDANKMFKCSNKGEAISKFNDLKNKWNGRYPNMIYNTEIKLGELLKFYDYPSEIRNSLKSTNEIERLNEEIRRRVKVVSSFPDEDSAMKIFYMKSVEFNSKHVFRKMNGYYKRNYEIKEIFIECPNIRQITMYIIFLPGTPVILFAITIQLYATIISPIDTS